MESEPLEPEQALDVADGGSIEPPEYIMAMPFPQQPEVLFTVAHEYTCEGLQQDGK